MPVHFRLKTTFELAYPAEHPDLRLFANEETPALSAEQHERKFIIFSMLISLFERAYLLL